MASVTDVAFARMDRAWAWGEADCCSAACSVYADLTGIDPMSRLRGLYRDAAGAAALIEAHGGLMGLAEVVATEVGMIATDDPQPGDLGVIAADGRQALAIHVEGGMWAAKSPRGITFVKEHVAAWTRA